MVGSDKMSNGPIAFFHVQDPDLEKSLCTFIRLWRCKLWYQGQHDLLLQNALGNPDALIAMFGFITNISFHSYMNVDSYGPKFSEKWYLTSSHLKGLWTLMGGHGYGNKRGELAHKRVSVLSGWTGMHLFWHWLWSPAHNVVNNQL